MSGITHSKLSSSVPPLIDGDDWDGAHLLTGVESTAPYLLDRSIFNSTYGDDFNESSLNARWSRHVMTSGEEAYQQGNNQSMLRMTLSSGAASRYIYQAAPAGDFTIEASFVNWQQTVTGQVVGLVCVDSSGNGVVAFMYDNAVGLYLGSVTAHAYNSAITNRTGVVDHRSGHAVTWLRLRKASGVYFVSSSTNGESYSPEISGTPSAFTPARIGFGRVLGTSTEDVYDLRWFDRTDTGSYPVNGLSNTPTINGSVLLEEHAASSSAQLDFTSCLSSAYDQYIVELVGIVPGTTNTDLHMRVGTGVGPTWDSGSNYRYLGQYNGFGDSTTVRSSTGAGQFQVCTNVSTTAGYAVSGEYLLSIPGGTLYPTMQGKSTNVAAGSAYWWEQTLWYMSTTTPTGLRFFMSSGNIASGTIRVYGVPKSAVGPGDYIAPAASAGKVTIPGLAVADRVPASPSVYNDEFDSYSGWTSVGSPDVATANGTGYPSNARIQKTVVPGVAGIYKACPSIPFTVTCKVSDVLPFASVAQWGLLLATASPGALMLFGAANTSSYTPYICVFSSSTTRTSATAGPFGGGQPLTFPYLRLVVNSSTNIDSYMSMNGIAWYPMHTAFNPGFTVGSVGLGISANVNNNAVDAYFDWIRFS